MTTPEEITPQQDQPTKAAKPDFKLVATDNGAILEGKGKKIVYRIELCPIPGVIQRLIGIEALTRVGTVIDNHNRKYAVFLNEANLEGEPLSLEQIREMLLKNQNPTV